MEQQQAPDGRARRRRTAQVVAAALLALFIAAAFSSSFGAGLGMLGLVTLIAGAWAVVRGHAGWVHLATRRAGLVVGVTGLAAFVVGAALSPTSTHTSAASATGSVAPSSVPAPRAVVAPPSSAAPVVEAAPLTTAAPAPTPSLPPAPTMALTCPAGGAVSSPVFGEQISATAPYTVDIDYGDGEHYRNDDQHLAVVFTHAYRVSGNFTVSALLTDPAGQTTSASCVYSWAKPVPVPAPAPRAIVGSGSGSSSSSSTSTSTNTGDATSTGGSSSGGSSSGGDTYTNVDGNQVHVPVQAPTQPAGATAQCRDGSWSFSQHHSGTCSGHGGVARWLG